MKQVMFLMFIVGVTALTDTEEWAKFKSRHGKTYRSTLEDRKRFNIFKQNLQKIQDHNAKYEKGEVSYAMKVTTFSDMTLEEFKDFLSKSFGNISKITDGSHLTSKSYLDYADDDEDEDTSDLPTAVDWKHKGAVTKVKNQGLCGSCWAFSAVGALEAQLYQKNGTLEDLSAQDLVDCADASYGNMGCAGGLMSNAFDYVKDKGILGENEYPYKGISDICRQKKEGFKIQSYIQHGKTYRSLLEEKMRFEIFKSNCRTIEEHNKRYHNGEETFEMKINQFGDMTQEEFQQMLTLQKDQMPLRSGDMMSLDDVQDLPKTVDWREKGAVTKVQDQGMCGSCWAFSAVGSIEGQVFLKKGKLEILSAQNLVDCAGKEYGNEGCNGGLMDFAFNYTKEHGILTEKEYPYRGRNGKCQKQGGVKISGYTDIPTGDEKALAKAVATVGPISIAIDASHLQFYFGGVVSKWSGCKNTQEKLNHGVLLVGYGDGFWIVKNSWAGWWGEHGYFRLKKDDGNTCGVATYASYPTL
ncbi:unnamed protein product [Callosobruchus maculatus]|uniref:Cathepsin L n=1 Tax=Callosobruchus maculatus TaxID=64391 RepID=A0A653CG28_CALMS|nr:unnamed protein product [Callosobruchus maculatus]